MPTFICSFHLHLLLLSLLMFPASGIALCITDPPSTCFHVMKWLSHCIHIVIMGHWCYRRCCALWIYKSCFLQPSELIFVWLCFSFRQTRNRPEGLISRIVLSPLIPQFCNLSLSMDIKCAIWVRGYGILADCLGNCRWLSNTLCVPLTWYADSPAFSGVLWAVTELFVVMDWRLVDGLAFDGAEVMTRAHQRQIILFPSKKSLSLVFLYIKQNSDFLQSLDLSEHFSCSAMQTAPLFFDKGIFI